MSITISLRKRLGKFILLLQTFLTLPIQLGFLFRVRHRNAINRTCLALIDGKSQSGRVSLSSHVPKDLYLKLFRENLVQSRKQVASILDKELGVFCKTVSFNCHERWSDEVLRLSVSDNNDIIYAWQLFRLQHLVHLAKVSWVEENEVVSDIYKSHLLNWCRHHSILEQRLTDSALEKAIRILSVAWSMAFVTKNPPLSRELIETVLKTVLAEALYIKRNLRKREFPRIMLYSF